MLVDRPDTEYKEHDPQDYVDKREQGFGYESNYTSTYDYPATEDTNGTTLSMETVCVFQCYPSFCLKSPFVRNCTYSSSVGHKLLRPEPNGIPITPWI